MQSMAAVIADNEMGFNKEFLMLHMEAMLQKELWLCNKKHNNLFSLK